MIKRVLWSACLLAATAGAGVSAAESSSWGIPLRVEWEADSPRDGVQAVCGRAHNDQPVTAWHVVFLVEELDAMERVTSSRQVEVLGEVPSEGNAVFCVPEPAGATSYRVRVIDAECMRVCENLTRGRDGPIVGRSSRTAVVAAPKGAGS